MMSARWIAIVCVVLFHIPSAQAQPALQLVESFPIETSLDHADIPDAHEVWLEMVRNANSTLDFTEFYASNKPGSRLEAIVQEIEAAAQRGVQVRFLADEKFHKTYPETLARLHAHDNIEVRRYDMTQLEGEYADGVLHAKYFLVDGDEAFLGSQNFDWRSLEHIQELGVRIRHPLLVAPLRDIFETDWQLAGGAPHSYRAEPPADGYGLPVRIPLDGGDVTATMVFSPRGLIPQADMWDLPAIVETIERAQSRVRVQLLSYKTIDWNSGYFDALETALRKAAARNVDVQLLLADWSKGKGTIEGLQSLQCLPNIEVRLMTIPEWSGGFIPFARVVHAKYLVVDGEYCWVGTSNWSRNYFYRSRNVGVLVNGTAFGTQLDHFFETGWNSSYAETVQPGRTYEAPRRQ
jgi:phosphatidylserine/phosphatidylglycerophosphate/cardiolipin synthase-like enzyme